MIAAHRDGETSSQRPIAFWLIACCVLVFAMVVLGGVTRLTGSGLAMVAWEPVAGILPPLDLNGWESEFARYQAFPEFQRVNSWMTLGEFQRIYWFEWAHRLLGRGIGIAFLLPFLFFAVTRRVDRALAPKLIVLFVLGGLQGLLGWYMVKSGLVDNPHVSQYRLAAHLAAAVVIYAYMLWIALALLRGTSPSASRPRTTAGAGFARVVAILVFVTMISGAFVAGLHAGSTFNTFPTMQGYWLPPGLYQMQPVILNLFEDVTTVQFNHRVLAALVFGCVIAVWFAVVLSRREARVRLWAHAAAAMAIVQVGLGIGTLLLAVPVPLAVAHQAGALILFTCMLCLCFELNIGRNAPEIPEKTPTN